MVSATDGMSEATNETTPQPTTITGGSRLTGKAASLGYLWAENCSSCGVPLEGEAATSFDCPECGETQIGRCRTCRDQSAKYSCSDCGHTGP